MWIVSMANKKKTQFPEFLVSITNSSTTTARPIIIIINNNSY